MGCWPHTIIRKRNIFGSSVVPWRTTTAKYLCRDMCFHPLDRWSLTAAINHSHLSAEGAEQMIIEYLFSNSINMLRLSRFVRQRCACATSYRFIASPSTEAEWVWQGTQLFIHSKLNPDHIIWHLFRSKIEWNHSGSRPIEQIQCEHDAMRKQSQNWLFRYDLKSN